MLAKNFTKQSQIEAAKAREKQPAYTKLCNQAANFSMTGQKKERTLKCTAMSETDFLR